MTVLHQYNMRFERNGKNDLKSAIITFYHIKKVLFQYIKTIWLSKKERWICTHSSSLVYMPVYALKPNYLVFSFYCQENMHEKVSKFII